MQFHEIMRVIEETTSDNWHKVDVAVTIGAELGVWTSGDGTFGGLDVKSHHSLAVYSQDVSLAVAWGLDQREGEAWDGAWVAWAKFPDSAVYGHFVDVLWCGVPVIRKLGVSVDGGRGVLPAPLPISSEEGSVTSEIVGWKVRQFDDRLFRLVDDLFYHGDYERYFQGAGFEVR